MSAPTVEVLAPTAPYYLAMPSGGGASSPGGPFTIRATTVAANYLLISVGQCTFGDAGIVSITSPGLTFTKLTSVIGRYAGPSYDGSDQEIWGAPISTPLNYALITITPTVGVDSVAVAAIGLIGYAGIDTGGANIPGVATSYLNYPMGVTYSTSSASDLVMYFGYSESNVDQGPPTGFTETAFNSAVGSSRSAGVTVAQYTPGSVLTGVTTTSPIPADHPSFQSSMIMMAFLGVTTATVPNVLGDTLSAATTAITAASLVVGTVTYTSSGTPNEVYSQSPVGGTSVSAGSAVNLVITYPPIPNVVGDTLAAATTALAAVSLTVGTITPTSSGTAGTVYSQSPAAGGVATPGNTENLTITYCTVPNVVGDTQAAATSAITAARLVLGTVLSVANAVTAGNVISQSPIAGALEPAGSPVNISVSLGPNPSGTVYLQAKFVPASVGAAIMIANPGNIHPRITPPERDTTVRIDPSWRNS